MPRFVNRKRAVAVLGGLAAVAIAAVAVAFWTGTGSGSGSGTVGASGTVTLVGTVAPGIAPGTAEPVALAASNATKSPIQVGAVELTGIEVDEAHETCVVADFTTAKVTENYEVLAEAAGEALPAEGSLVYANTGVSQDACKGATLTLTLASS